MADGLKDLHPRVTELATRLGVRFELTAIPGTKWCYLKEFALVVSGATLRGTPRLTPKGALVGVTFEFSGTAPLSNARIVARRERWVDRLGKMLRINREVELGDPRLDRAVYFETDAADSTLRHLFGDQRARDVLLELLSGTAESVIVAPVEEGRAREPRLVADAVERSIAIEISVSWFSDVPSIGRSADALARLGALVGETSGPAGPYGRGGFVALPPATKTRFARGIVVSAIAIATWVGFIALPALTAPTFGWSAFGIGAALGAVAWIVLVALAIALLRGRSTSFRYVILAAFGLLGVVPFGGRVGEVLNAALDGGPFHDEPGAVVLRRGSKGGTTNELQLLSTGESANVHGALADAVPFNLAPARVRITVGRGALGSPFAAGLAPP